MLIFNDGGGRGMSLKVIFHDKGVMGGQPESVFLMIKEEGGVSQKVFFNDQGGESRPPLKSMTSLMNSPLLDHHS